MSAAWIDTISNRYIELYEKVIGEKFIPSNLSDVEIFDLTLKSIQRLKA